MEAAIGIEPMIRALQAPALPLGDAALKRQADPYGPPQPAQACLRPLQRGGQVRLEVERATRFELATFCLGSRCSTTELRPHPRIRRSLPPLLEQSGGRYWI